MDGVSCFPVPAALQRYYAALHRAELRAKQPGTVPAILGQVWFTTKPFWWLPSKSRTPKRLPPSALVGFTSRCFEIVAEEDSCLYVFGFWPLGWAELVRRPAADFVDLATDAATVWPEICNRWHHFSGDADGEGWPEPLSEAPHSLASGAQTSPDLHRISLIDNRLNSDGTPAELADLLNLSTRQVERVTARTHGGSPRLLAGKWRALRAASEMELAGTDKADTWARYADQSHLIREFRRFIDTTPKPFYADQSLAKRIVTDAWHLESEHPLALTHKK